MKLSLRKQRGFTLTELLVGLFWLLFWGTLIVVAVHFIAKFW